MYPNKLQFVIQVPLKLQSAVTRCSNRSTNFNKCKKAKKRIIYRPVYSSNQETSELNGIILKKLPVCQKKNHQANQSKDLLVQHEKNTVKNCHCATKTKKEKKWMCLAKSQYYMNKILWKTIIVQWKERRKKILYLSAKQWINSLMLWTKFFEKLSLCNEGKERTKKKRLSLFSFSSLFCHQSSPGSSFVATRQKRTL